MDNTDQSITDLYAKTDQLLALTQAMLAAANLNDWETFKVLEQQRKVMLDLVFGSQAIEESAESHLTEVANAILSADKTITGLAIQQRDLAAEGLRYLKQARKGSEAYRLVVESK